MCAKIKNLLIIATIKIRVFPNLYKKYIENKRLFVDFVYFFTIKLKNIKSKKVKISKSKIPAKSRIYVCLAMFLCKSAFAIMEREKSIMSGSGYATL